MLGKRLIKAGAVAAGGLVPSEHFETVLYTGNGSTQRIGGYINRGASGFDYNKYITFPDMGGFTSNTSDADGSLSIWFNLDSIPATSSNYYTLIDRGNPNSYTSTYQALELILFGTSNTNEVTFNFRRGFGGTNYDPPSYSATATTLSANTWYHLVVSYVASTKTATFYLNGTSIGSYSLTSSAGGRTIDSGFNIGTYANSTSYAGYKWYGKVDQFRIFNKAISSGEVSTLYGETYASSTISTTDIFSDNSGVALYQFDGNANDTGGVSGKFGEAAIFNGSGYISTSLNLDTYDETWSISMWIKFNFNSSYRGIAGSVNSSAQNGFVIDIGTSGELRFRLRSSSTSVSALASSSTYGDGNWHHIVAVKGSTTNYLYIDGNAESLSVGTTNGISHSTGITLGRLGLYTADYFLGNIDDVRLYDDEITASEALNIYNNTSIPTDNLVAYYKFDGDARDEQQQYDATATNVSYAYNGTATNVTYQEATKFQPDFVWLKNRDSGTANHRLYNSITYGGPVADGSSTSYLKSNTTDAEASSTNTLTSLDSNGFSVYGTGGETNANGNDFVAWCFKGGGTAVSANSIEATNATRSVNQTAGFSIIKFTSSANTPTPPPMNYIEHGLSATPELVIYKDLNTTGNWRVNVPTILGNNGGLSLNLTSAASSGFTYDFYDPDATYIGVRSNYAIGSNTNYIAYAFHSVDGFSKVGSYTGTGAAGNRIETGFEPAWVMIKSSSNISDWYIIDNERPGGNPSNKFLIANGSGAEYTASESDALRFYSNGFEVGSNGSYNNSGYTWIYYAIAADPDTTTPTVQNSFDVVTYTGNGTSLDIVTDFKPDLVWIKSRTVAREHILSDSVRGVNKEISTNDTAAEEARGIASFNENGFSLDNATPNYNYNNENYVAWCWKAGDHDDNLPQINTEGTINSVVSVNAEAGFSIVKYTGGALISNTVGHGLSQAPELIIQKATSVIRNWNVYSADVGASKNMHLNLTDAANTDEYWSVNSSTFAIQDQTASADRVAYCFHSVTGYQKIGSYTGTGTSGNSINLGFEPRFVIVKNTNDLGNWGMYDSIRDTDGTIGKTLYANLSNAEADAATATITTSSTGFTIGNSNSIHLNRSGDVFIYLAIK